MRPINGGHCVNHHVVKGEGGIKSNHEEGVSQQIQRGMNDDKAKRLGVIGHDTRMAKMMEIHNAQ